MKTTISINDRRFDIYLSSANVLALSGMAIIKTSIKAQQWEMMLIAWGIMMLGLSENGDNFHIKEI